MSKMYSASKINSFNTCKLKYKYQYIDRIDSDVETIERFLGSVVHEVLEHFYNLVKGGKVESIDWILDKYREIWSKKYNNDIKIVKKQFTAIDYFKKGGKSIRDYYEKYDPFDQTKIIGTESFERFKVESGKDKYDFCGILDRLDWNDKDKIYEIHDYKASNSLLTQEKADKDWQLGLYYIALIKKWPDANNAKLIWHYLFFNKEVVSSREKGDIKELQKDIILKVKEIESCKEFPPQKSALCNWCDYQNICPLWTHPKKMEEFDVKKYKKDLGVKLVKDYKELEEKKNGLKEKILKIEEDQLKLEETVFKFAEENKLSVIDGLGAQLKLDIKSEMKPPTRSEDVKKWENLRKFLKKEKKYEEVSTVSNSMLKYNMRDWPKGLIDKVLKYFIKKETRNVKLINKDF